MTRPTPLTDATQFNVYKQRNLARRLERERAELIEALGKILEAHGKDHPNPASYCQIIYPPIIEASAVLERVKEEK